MPSRREILALLTRDELLGIVDQFELEVPNRRAKDGLIEAIGSSKKANLPELLPGLTRDSLKALCQGLGLDNSGRDKASLLDRLVSAKVTRADSASPPLGVEWVHGLALSPVPVAFPCLV